MLSALLGMYSHQPATRALMGMADAITDTERRPIFLTNIPHHRDVVALLGRARRATAGVAPAQPN